MAKAREQDLHNLPPGQAVQIAFGHTYTELGTQ